jgi:hypothetical protein
VHTFAARKRNSGTFSDKMQAKKLKIKFVGFEKVATFATRKRGND